MDESLRDEVWQRAYSQCEYCQLPQAYTPLTHEVDHIIASKHRGRTVASNLGLACYACNKHKGTDLAGIDPLSNKIARVFHPRRHKWSAHFRWQGAVLVGRTAIGRTTIAVLQINLAYRVAFRQALIDEGVFPPK